MLHLLLGLPYLMLGLIALPILGGLAARYLIRSTPCVGATVGLLLHLGVVVPIVPVRSWARWEEALRNVEAYDLVVATTVWTPWVEWTDHARDWAATSVSLVAMACAITAVLLATVAMMRPRRRAIFLWAAGIVSLPLAHLYVYAVFGFIPAVVLIAEAHSLPEKLRLRETFRSLSAGEVPPTTAPQRRSGSPAAGPDSAT